MERIFNIVTFGKRIENLEIAIREGKIGSDLSTISEHISRNSILFLHCRGAIVAIAQPSGPYEFSQSRIWDNKVYPHRFPIKVTRYMAKPMPLCDDRINVELRERFGAGWAYKFLFAPKPLPDDIGRAILAGVEKVGTTAPDTFCRIFDMLAQSR
jgi:hypothetical protein